MIIMTPDALQPENVSMTAMQAVAGDDLYNGPPVKITF